MAEYGRYHWAQDTERRGGEAEDYSWAETEAGARSCPGAEAEVAEGGRPADDAGATSGVGQTPGAAPTPAAYPGCAVPAPPQPQEAAGQAEPEAAPLSSYELGRKGERSAAEYLERHGWEVVERNWRCPYGEADLIVRDPVDPEGEVVLVEVKTRRVPEGSGVFPEEAVDDEKRARYEALMQRYLQEHAGTHNARFDVISIVDNGSGTAHLRHYARCERR